MLCLALGKSEAELMKAAVVVSGDALWEVFAAAVPACRDPRKAAAFSCSMPASLPLLPVQRVPVQSRSC